MKIALRKSASESINQCILSSLWKSGKYLDAGQRSPNHTNTSAFSQQLFFVVVKIEETWLRAVKMALTFNSLGFYSESFCDLSMNIKVEKVKTCPYVTYQGRGDIWISSGKTELRFQLNIISICSINIFGSSQSQRNWYIIIFHYPCIFI